MTHQHPQDINKTVIDPDGTQLDASGVNDAATECKEDTGLMVMKLNSRCKRIPCHGPLLELELLLF